MWCNRSRMRLYEYLSSKGSEMLDSLSKLRHDLYYGMYKISDPSDVMFTCYSNSSEGPFADLFQKRTFLGKMH